MGSAHLDFCRAVAAAAVMWEHLRGLFFVAHSGVRHGSRALDALYFITGFGHQAVMVFFVLSGFLISSAIFRRRSSGTWSWRDYAIDRSSRLYVVLIPGLLSGLLFDKLGSRLFAVPGLYSHPLADFGGAIPLQQLTFRNFCGNLLFLQTIRCPAFGSNGPLWSLANEFWYYALFPLALFAALAWAKLSFRAAIFLTLLAFCVGAFVGWSILAGFPIWLAGCALLIAYSKLRLKAAAWLALYLAVASAGLCVCLVAARFEKYGALGSDLCVGCAFTLLLFGILQIEFGKPNAAYAKISHFLADFSYTLYVVHFPLLLFLRASIAPYARWQPDALHLTTGAAIGAGVLTLAWLVSLVTEKRTRAVRSVMRNLLPRLDAAAWPE